MEAVAIIIAIVSLAIFVLTIAGMWKAFEKAGRPGWAAIIPIYNNYQMLKIGRHSGWWLLVFVLPVLPSIVSLFTGVANAQGVPSGLPAGSMELPAVGGGLLAVVLLSFLAFFALFQLVLIVNVVMHYDVARAFGKSIAFTLGLMLLPFIFWPILGFGKAEYVGACPHACKDCETGGKNAARTSSDSGASEEDMYTDLQS